MTVKLYQGDIPADLKLGKSIAVDTEAMGLKNYRDRLCLVQLSTGDGVAHLVQFKKGDYDAPNLKKALANNKIEKIFHFARFDVAIIKHYLGIDCTPIYCTRTVSKLIRTYTERHSLRELCRIYAGVDLNKQQQSSDWGAEELSLEQLDYAASDVLYLHKIKEAMDPILDREGRRELAQGCFDFMMIRAKLDLAGWNNQDIFEH